MDSPTFKVGMVFADVKQLRQAQNAYSIRNRVEIKKIKNEKNQIGGSVQAWLSMAS